MDDHPSFGEMKVDVDDTTSLYRIIKTVVAPRPIAWVSTRRADNDNLAPFSWFNVVSPERPAVIVFSVGTRDDGDKDTDGNVIETGEFAVNIVTEDLAEQMDRTSVALAPDESEFEYAGVEAADCECITPKRVGQAAVTLECTLYDWLEFGGHHTAIFGEVVFAHIDDEVVSEGEIDATKICHVGRLGGPYYTTVDPGKLEGSTRT
jgi:flavin reductase (DIM6/NTAB) family NADH-FMN oxidoreductase RutF